MKNYTITVNGNVYHVTVEEGTEQARRRRPRCPPLPPRLRHPPRLPLRLRIRLRPLPWEAPRALWKSLLPCPERSAKLRQSRDRL